MELNKTKDEVTIGRLRKRIAKLTQQRDHWKTEHDSLLVFFQVYPYIMADKREHQKRVYDRKRLQELEVTQAILVRELEKYEKPERDRPK